MLYPVSFLLPSDFHLSISFLSRAREHIGILLLLLLLLLVSSTLSQVSSPSVIFSKEKEGGRGEGEEEEDVITLFRKWRKQLLFSLRGERKPVILPPPLSPFFFTEKMEGVKASNSPDWKLRPFGVGDGFAKEKPNGSNRVVLHFFFACAENASLHT